MPALRRSKSKMTRRQVSRTSQTRAPGRARAPGSRRRAVADGLARVRIAVAASQLIDRAGLIGLLKANADFQIVGQSSSVEDTVHLCGRIRPDVLLLTL